MTTTTNPFDSNGSSQRLDASAMMNVLEDLAESSAASDGSGRILSSSPFRYRGTILLPKEMKESLMVNAFIRNIVYALPVDAKKEGWNISFGEEYDDEQSRKIVKDYKSYHKRLKTIDRLFKADVTARTYRGAVIVMNIDDGRPYDQPVNEKAIKTIKSLIVRDCYHIRPDMSGQLIVDPIEDITHYYINTTDHVMYESLGGEKGKLGAFQYNKIHKDRILRFDGALMPDDWMRAQDGWGVSAIDLVYEYFKDWMASLKAIGEIINTASILTYAIKGFKELIQSNDENLLRKRLSIIRSMLSVFGGIAMDSDSERVDYVSRPFNGLESAGAVPRDAFIGASSIPHTKIFGESPSGLGATGESESQTWANTVMGHQHNVWLPPLERLDYYVFLAKDGPTKGKLPEDYTHSFKSIIAVSEVEKKEGRASDINNLLSAIQGEFLTPDEARTVLSDSGWWPELNLDVKAWEKAKKDTEAQAQQEQFGGFDPYAEENAMPAEEEVPAEEPLPPEEAGRTDSITRRDSNEKRTIKKVLRWGGVDIGITHEPGDFRYGRPMTASYGHIRRSYGSAEDGKALDVYVGKNLAPDAAAYKVRQLKPESGEVDEVKYFIGYESPQDVKATFVHHAGSHRFGGVEACSADEFVNYRQDNCGCPDYQASLQSKVYVLPPAVKAQLEEIKERPEAARGFLSNLLSQIYPEPILQVTTVEMNPEGIKGEFISTIGKYAFKYQHGYIGYGFREDTAKKFDALPDEEDFDESDWIVEYMRDLIKSPIAKTSQQIESILREIGEKDLSDSEKYKQFDEAVIKLLGNLDHSSEEFYQGLMIAEMAGRLNLLDSNA